MTWGDIFIIDDFNLYLATLTNFVGFTTAIFSASNHACNDQFSLAAWRVQMAPIDDSEFPQDQPLTEN